MPAWVASVILEMSDEIRSLNLMSSQLLSGLTTEEVEERHRRGQSNRPSRSAHLQYVEIVSRNVFTLFNAIVVPAASFS